MERQVDLKNTMAAIAVHHSKIEQNERMAENLLQQIIPQIRGRRIERTGKYLGNLAGVYEITKVRLSYDAQIEVHGRKVLGNGSLGSTDWDLGAISFARLLPIEESSAA